MLNPKERAALAHVRDQLLSGAVPHLPEEEWNSPQVHPLHFNMLIEHDSQHECGTVACISGLTALALHPKASHQEVWQGIRWLLEREPALHALFYPDGHHHNTTTPQDAAQAITNFLAGQDPWGSLPT